MSQPTPYTRQYSFTNAFAASPTMTFPGSALDLELNSAKSTIDQVLQNLKLAQNDDGTIKNGSIGPEQLSTVLTVGFLPPTIWAPSTGYTASPASTVFNSNKFYTCKISHVSSNSFSTDLAVGDWVLITDLTGIPLQTASNIAVTPTGGIVTSDLQSALAGIDTRVTTNATAFTGFVVANITDSTATGRALVTAASTDAALSALNAWGTGDVKLTIKANADGGWLMMADQTIGSAGSGATFADASASPLYTILWNNIADTYAPVTGGRGVSATADWNANKKIALLKVLGRALAIGGAGSGLTSRALGQTVGEETHTLTAGESASLTYSSPVTDTHTHEVFGETIAVQSGAGTNIHQLRSTTGSGDVPTSNTAGGSGSITVATSSNAGGSSHNNMQPSSFFNVMIKL